MQQASVFGNFLEFLLYMYIHEFFLGEGLDTPCLAWIYLSVIRIIFCLSGYCPIIF